MYSWLILRFLMGLNLIQTHMIGLSKTCNRSPFYVLPALFGQLNHTYVTDLLIC